MSDSKTFHIKSYGCQMNVYDSERMAELLVGEGYSAAQDAHSADLVVLNTCHIREKAAEKVYSDVGRLRVGKKDGALVAVAGCVAQAEGAQIMRRDATVNLVFGPQTYHRLPEMLATAAEHQRQGFTPHVVDTDFPVEAKFDHLSKQRRSPGVTAFVTVQEGCDKFCSFCVVPYTRGGEVSRPVAAIVQEVAQLVEQGVKEITLLGQNVNAYHGAHGSSSASLADLMQEMVDKSGISRIRYMTSHPYDMGDDLIAAHANLPQLMPYVHLPVQSGSNRILKAMNRKHTAESYLHTLAKLRHARADLALSGDFIVGFPGETDADFEETLALVRAVGYASAYSFKYSPRPGTPAAEMGDQIEEAVKADRLARLQSLLAEQQLAFNQACVGKTMSVVLERPGKFANQLIGRSPWLQSVHVIDPTLKIGDCTDVTIASAGGNSLEGQRIMDEAA
jgi:tRNA-2-methylthio-N6-dimethylallyladenosine synthase